MFLIGIANSLVDVNAYTLIQRIAPAEVMGRVFGALESIVIAGMALGSLLMAVLIATAGLRWGLVVIGASVAALARRRDGAAAAHRHARHSPRPAWRCCVRSRRWPCCPRPCSNGSPPRSCRVTVPAGTTVVEEGEPGDRFWVIERGRATVSIGGRHVRELGPGDSFGEIALLRDIPRTATVRAAEELVLQGLDRSVFIPAVTGHGESSEVADAQIERWLEP